MSDVLQSLLTTTLVPLLGALLVAAAGWLAAAGRAYLTERTKAVKAERIRGALDHLITVAATAVAETSQTAVDHLKASSSDGQLTRDEASAALQAAATRAWEMLGAGLRQTLSELAGGATPAIDTLVKPAIEAAVRNQKIYAAPTTAAPANDAVRAREVALAHARLGLR